MEIKQNTFKQMISRSHLNQYPYSPRKMRLIANIIRNMDVNKALEILKHSKKHAAIPIAKFLISAIFNWKLKTCKLKNEYKKLENLNLYIKEIKVNSSRVLKRLRAAPKGKGHIIRKKSSNISLILSNKI